MDNFCFIIIRYVSNEQSNLYWKECYTCLRKFYNNLIVIIDDNSNNFLTEDIELINCKTIKSEFPNAREILGYYYFHKHHFSQKAIIIQDTVFFNKFIDFSTINDVKFLWSFGESHTDLDPEVLKLIYRLDNFMEVAALYLAKYKWRGCFANMSIISYQLLDKINLRYKFLDNLVPIISTKEDRMWLERIFACLCYLTAPSDLQDQPHVFNDIFEYCQWGLRFGHYNYHHMHWLPVAKVWE